MVVVKGDWTVSKPSRSDEVIDADQQVQIASQVRAHFDSLAPKRSIKPNRSESDQTSPTSPPYVANKSIPELDKLRSLKSQSHAAAIYKEEEEEEEEEEDEGVTVQDEFVETQYYKELGSIDKQHHTTGSGFIKAVPVPVREGGYHLHLHLQSGANTDQTLLFTAGFRSNPATNDWIPTVDADHHQVVSLSSKPSRSESS